MTLTLAFRAPDAGPARELPSTVAGVMQDGLLLMHNGGDETVHVARTTIEVVDTAPSGREARRRAETFRRPEEVSTLAIGPGATTELYVELLPAAFGEPGCHALRAEVTVEAGRAISNAIVTRVELGNYTDGAAGSRVTSARLWEDCGPFDASRGQLVRAFDFEAVGLHRGSDGAVAVVTASSAEDRGSGDDWRARAVPAAPSARDLVASDAMWLEGHDVTNGVDHVTVDLWPQRILATALRHALVLAGPERTGPASALVRVYLGAEQPPAIAWSYPLPPELGWVRDGDAALDDFANGGSGPTLALLGESEEGVVLSLAEGFDGSPPAGFVRRVLVGYEPHPDARPVVTGRSSPSVGALVRQRGAPTIAWDLVRWSVPADELATHRIAPAAEPVSAGLAFVYPQWMADPAPRLVAVFVDGARRVTLWPGGSERAALAPHESLRVAVDDRGVYLLRLDPARGPYLLPLDPGALGAGPWPDRHP
ncbi:MAG: hypothetical protein IT373_15040 [Polyangiaceae bacterium]|nr:hypothetical protein [Polyangiaceae bacterium]